MIVLVTHPGDEHGLVVLDELRRRGADVAVLDTGAFPRGMSVAAWPADAGGWRGEAVLDGQRRDLRNARAVWYRRPLPFVLHDEVRGQDDRAFAYGECQAAMTGLWSCLDAFWVNDPDRDAIASRKTYQLKVATAIGLRTPRTCMTNDPEAAAAFAAAEAPGPTVYKSFSATERAWRETRVLRPEEHDLVGNVRFAPVIFQEYVTGADLRITVVGERIFPGLFTPPEGGYPHDFRMAMEGAAFEPHELPAEVEKSLLALTGALGIVYGAVDMRLTPEGEYVFFEVNPAGQWLFVELSTGQPITAALCDVLVEGGAG